MKIAICTPHYTPLDDEHRECTEAFIALAAQHGHEAWAERIRGLALITQARSVIARRALDKGADVLLWVDSDMIFVPQEALVLCEECDSDHVIIGSPCSNKKCLGVICCSFLPETKNVKFFAEGCLMEIEDVGLGLTATHRSVYEALAKTDQCSEVICCVDHITVNPFFQEIFVPYKGKTLWAGEDYSFTILARELGYKIWMDTRLRVLHVGRYGFKIEDVLSCISAVTNLTIDVQEGKLVEPDKTKVLELVMPDVKVA